MANKVDNLTPTSTASEMEQAIKEVTEQTNTSQPSIPDKVIEAKEVVENKEQPKEEVEAQTSPTEDKEFDYKKGYEGLRAWQTKIAQKLSDQEKHLEEFRTSQIEKQLETKPQMTQEQFLEWHANNPLEANAWLAQEQAKAVLQPYAQRMRNSEEALAGIIGQSIANQYRAKYSDFVPLEEEIKEEVNRMPPELTDNPKYYATTLETAYWAVKGKKMHEVSEKARAEGRREATAKADAKKDAYVEGSTASKSEEPIDLQAMKADDIYALLKARGAVPQ